MSVYAELHDGRRLEFPDGTDPQIIQSTVRKVLGAQQAPEQEPTTWEKIRPYVAPTIEGLAAGGGAILGAGAGTLLGPGPGNVAGGIAGAGLGYGIAREGLNLADQYLGNKAPRQGAEQITEPLRNVLEGSTYEVGGRVAGPLIAKGVGKVINMGSLPTNKAVNLARNALGSDTTAAVNALRAAQGQNVSTAQATVDVVNPRWQAFVDRVTARDPAAGLKLAQSQADESLNAMTRGAGGPTATAVRGTTDAAKQNLNATTTPMREAALSRANLGKEVARLESMSAELGEQAAAKVQEVRKLMEAGDSALAWTRLNLIKRGLPVGGAKYTYAGELADKAFKEWSDKAAQASLDLGQGARFAEEAAGALRSVGIKPLEGKPIIDSMRGIATRPEFAGNDLLSGALQNVADDITKWSGSGGVIDARALDAIRKNAVNAAIAKLRPGADATTQRNAAAGVMTKIKPFIDDAIEGAGGAGWRDYLTTHSKGMQKIAEKELQGEALQLWKTNKDAFVKLVQGESPEVVEKFLGPGKYDIATELADNTMSTLRAEAAKAIRNAKVKEQVGLGQDALRELMLQNMSIWRLPSYLSVITSTVNKGLTALEKNIGKRTMDTLTKALQTPEGAANLLETLPASERSRILQLMSDPTKWSTPARGVVTGTVATVKNALSPTENQNSLTRD